MRRAAQLLAVLCVVVLVATAAVAGGKKPPGGDDPSTGGGTIYFRHADQVWSMDSDGRQKTPLPVFPGPMAEPSRLLHDGADGVAHRWFLTLQEVGTYGTNSYGNPWPRYELVAVRDDGLTQQLTFEADLEELAAPVNADFFQIDTNCLRWSRDDSRVSWVARLWDVPDLANGTVLEAGIYSLGTDFVNGIPEPTGDPTLLVSTGAPHTHYFYGPTPCVHGHDWSPDGTLIAYGRCNEPGPGVLAPVVSLLDLTEPSVIFEVVEGEAPAWSHDGASIAFMSPDTEAISRGVATIGVDGSDGRVIFADVRTKRTGYLTDRHLRPSWSPTDSHLCCYRQYYDPHLSWYYGDALRADADGQRQTNLTKDLKSSQLEIFVIPIGWR